VLRGVVERRILSGSGFSELQELQDKQAIPKGATLFPEFENQGNQLNQPNHSSDTVAPNHILIEGDNLHALTALSFTHEGRIDVIYIDPPYNTGSKEDFIYNDHYVDREDDFRHSKWLSFMSKRLNLAKKLMSADGVIFCSIGDDEISQLTLLFNEIFTEENKLGNITRISKTSGDQGNYFSSSKDHVLVYTKNKTILSNFKDDVDVGLFKKIEKEGVRKGEYYRDDVAFYQATLGVRPNLRYFIECPDGTLAIPPGDVFPEEKKACEKVIPLSDNDKVWRWSLDTYLKQKQLIVFKQTKKSPLLDENRNKSNWNLYTKSYLTDRSEKGASPRDYLDEYINRKGADLIKQYDIDFSYSKPFELIQHLIKITNKNNDIVILDFFAGSGATLHAVVSLNEIDSGKRTCIIATNNESEICDKVTFLRCERIIKPYTNSKGKEMPFYPNNNLRYYKCEFVPSLKDEPNKRLLTQTSSDLLCIKEDCYAELTESVGFNLVQCRIFTNDRGKYLVVIYHSRRQMEVFELIIAYIKSLENLSEPVKLYAFSPEKETLMEDFAEIADKIEAVPLPEAIYNAYRSAFKTLKLDRTVETMHALSQNQLSDENELPDPNQDPE